MISIPSCNLEEFVGALTLGLICQEMVHLRDGAVKGHNVEAVVSGVENQILAHDGQANKAKITSSHIVSIWRRIGEVRSSPRRSAHVDPREAYAGGGREV